MNEQKLEKWVTWIKRVRDEVLWLNYHRNLWQSLDGELEPNPAANFFREHYMRMYVSTSAMTIRRLSETGQDKNARSLVLLIQQIASEEDGPTAHWYGSRFASNAMGIEFWSAVFEEKWGDVSGRLDRSKAFEDVAGLTAACEAVAAFADRIVAHLDKRGAIGAVTFSELDVAIEAINATFQRYYTLLTGGSLTSLEPAIQGDWKAPFRERLFTNELHYP